MKSLSDEILSTLDTVSDFPKPGILFKDISPMFFNPDLVMRMTRALAHDFGTHRPEIIFGIESRGFLMGVPVAAELGIPFAMIRKTGKLPGRLLGVSYDLEYGSARIEIQARDEFKGKRAAIIDDVLATGGTARASIELLRMSGVVPVALGVLLELTSLNGRQSIETLDCSIISLAKTD